MNESLRLDYVCTATEIQEVQTLGLQQELGGCKLLTAAFLLLIMAAIGLGLFLQVRHFPSGHTVYVVAAAGLIAMILIGVQAWMKKPLAPTTVEIGSEGLKFEAASGHSTVPWSAFDELLESDKLFVLRERSGAVLYVLPKRVFPDEHACDWFRTLANVSILPNLDMVNEPPAVASAAVLSADDGTVTIQFKLCYRDYVDRSLASWFMRGMMLGAAGLVLGTFVAASLKPLPGAVYSNWQVFLFFVVPFLIATECIVCIVVTTHTWLAHLGNLRLQTVTFSEAGITETTGETHTRLNWETPTRFKETLRSFIVWWPGTRGWIQIPKRAFASPAEIDRCRQLLAAKATPSSMFFW